MPSTCPACDGILDLVFEEGIEDRGLDSDAYSPGVWIWRN
jgi:hypothetical protein